VYSVREEEKKMLPNGRRIYQEGLKTEMILLAIEDVTGKM